MITVILVDDHQVVLQGLRVLLQAEDDIQVIAEAADGLAAVEVAEKLKPDVLVLDLMLPGLSGLEVTGYIHNRIPQTSVVIFTMYTDETFVVEALKQGASAYVLKRSDTAELVDAVRTVWRGEIYLSPKLSKPVIDLYRLQATPANYDLYETLTQREREVLQASAEGLSNQEIAQRLTISIRTVEMHRSNMMHKLELRSHVDLVRYALRKKLISID